MISHLVYRNFDTRISKKYDVGNEDDEKCLNCRDTNHFARDCNVNNNDLKEESYELKHKRLLDSLKKQNLGSKLLIAKEEEWIEEEESSNEDVKIDVCIMTITDESFTDEARNNSSIFDTDLTKAISDSKAQN